MPRKKVASFEENLMDLEDIVTRLEGGEAGLEEIMADYTQGMKLAKTCMEALQKAEKQLDVLLQEEADGSVIEDQLVIEGEQ